MADRNGRLARQDELFRTLDQLFAKQPWAYWQQKMHAAHVPCGVVNTVPPKDRDIAMVFQNYALYPHMTVFDNIAYGLNARPRATRPTKAEIDALTGKLDAALTLRAGRAELTRAALTLNSATSPFAVTAALTAPVSFPATKPLAGRATVTGLPAAWANPALGPTAQFTAGAFSGEATFTLDPASPTLTLSGSTLWLESATPPVLIDRALTHATAVAERPAWAERPICEPPTPTTHPSKFVSSPRTVRLPVTTRLSKRRLAKSVSKASRPVPVCTKFARRLVVPKGAEAATDISPAFIM